LTFDFLYAKKEEVMMVELNVSLPDPVYDWVKGQVAVGHFASSSDYVRELIMQVQKLQLLQQAITEGLESGVSEFSIADIISEVKAELKAV
jgi:antitoxin ParD1/3/4